MNSESCLRAPASPGVHVSRRPPAQFGLVGRRLRLSCVVGLGDAGASAARSDLGLGSGSEGSPSARAVRQNGVNTLNGSPALVLISHGSTSR